MLALGSRLAADKSSLHTNARRGQERGREQHSQDVVDEDAKTLQSLFDLIEKTRHSLERHLAPRTNSNHAVAESVSSVKSPLSVKVPGDDSESSRVHEALMQEFVGCEESVYAYFVQRESNLRATYKESRDRLENSVSSASAMAEEVHNLVQTLRLQERRLFARREALTKELRAANSRQERLRVSVINIESQRKAALDSIHQPAWEVPHHFHMTAVEHFRGNKQRQLADIANLFPGHLRVLAIARRTADLPGRVFPEFQKAQKAWQAAALAVKKIVEEHKQKKNEVDVLHARLAELQRRIGAEARRQMRAAHGKLKMYRSIKHRYFAALNLTHAPDEESSNQHRIEVDDSNDVIDVSAWCQRIDAAIEELESIRIRCKQAWDALQKLVSVKRNLEGELCVLRVRLQAPQLRSLSQDYTSVSPMRSPRARLRSSPRHGSRRRQPSPRSSPRSESPSFFGSGSPVSPSIMALG